jgi:hypothetical protein
VLSSTTIFPKNELVALEVPVEDAVLVPDVVTDLKAELVAVDVGVLVVVVIVVVVVVRHVSAEFRLV